MTKLFFNINNIIYKKNKKNLIYNKLMILSIVLSLTSLTVKKESIIINLIDITTVSIFIIDYFLRWITSNLRIKKGVISFLIYPFTFWGILDLLSILPSFHIMSKSLKLLRLLRISKLFKGIRILKLFRFSEDLKLILLILKKEKSALISCGILAIGYIFLTALLIFNLEPNSFNSFFDAFYWATISLTTVGYGDIYAISKIGKIITMISSLCGIALIAMPASIITSRILIEKNNANSSTKKN